MLTSPSMNPLPLMVMVPPVANGLGVRICTMVGTIWRREAAFGPDDVEVPGHGVIGDQHRQAGPVGGDRGGGDEPGAAQVVIARLDREDHLGAGVEPGSRAA